MNFSCNYICNKLIFRSIIIQWNSIGSIVTILLVSFERLNSTVSSFIPVNKLILAIPTYGRTWVVNKDTPRTGIPPLKVEGPGEKGSLIQEEGYLSYGEICSQLASLTDVNASPTTLRKVPDPQKRLGTYAFRLPNKQLKNEYGIWVSYEDPETIGAKATYVKQNGLAGVAMVDLTLDDFKGNCGEKYVLVKSAKNSLK